MVQAAVLGGPFFDLFSLFDDGGVASKVGVGWSYVADALVVALVVVVIDEGPDLVFEIAGYLLTDKLPSYGAALKDLGLARHHDFGGRKNNRAENSPLPVRQRERPMQRFKSA